MSVQRPDEFFHINSAYPERPSNFSSAWDIDFQPLEKEARILQYKLIQGPRLQHSRLEFDSSVNVVSAVPKGLMTFAISQSPVGRPTWNNQKLLPNEIVVLNSDEPVHFICEPNEVLFTITTTLEHYEQCREKHSTIDVLASRKKHRFQTDKFQLMQSAIQAISASCAQGNEYSGIPHNDFANSNTENSLLGSLLQILTPDSNSARETPQRRQIARKAIEYIHENISQPFNMNTLVDQLETTHRTLHLGFIETFGTSPIAYLKNLRLSNARRDLIKKTWPTVTETAMHWNFHHLGRFSRDYQAAYGESPSATVKRNFG